MQKKKSALIALVALVLVAAALLTVYFVTAEDPVAGSKTITVQMIYDDVDRSVTISTDAEYLRGALEQEDLVVGTESQYGLFISAIDGRVADEAKQEWWGVTENGEMASTGIDAIVIEDGDHFELTLNTGW